MNSPTFALHALIFIICHLLMFNLKYFTKTALEPKISIYIWKAEDVRNLILHISSQSTVWPWTYTGWNSNFLNKKVIKFCNVNFSLVITNLLIIHIIWFRNRLTVRILESINLMYAFSGYRVLQKKLIIFFQMKSFFTQKT